ncbi:flagellar assembly peptidoglycan hydrolase FlgJ [Halochromatium salexigens]|uniref:Peptidoglycan hydrolase FlgJ n=1 Tax=Halochromatium salexigens TaxID=49447 RepID=A0AAJ0UFR8_HALSE|nr:flagellar assembly peptidoglycan hydrolase FlgJ [Halochromatium salexigens]MBK5929782.1 flagellar assembly peptidoglycan hydrolase FlgJ [Halochromatium salexigens]
MRLDGAEGQFALDLQGLQRLQQGAREQTPEATRAAAQQFEALFLHQMIKSMRATVPSSGLTDSRHTEFYQSLLDHQWAQTMAERGVGLADLLVEQFESGRYGGAGRVDTAGADAAANARGPSSDADNAVGDADGKPALASASDPTELIAGIPRGTPRLVETPRLSPAELEAAAAASASTATATAAANDAEQEPPPASFLDAWGGRSTGSLLGEHEERATGGLRAGWKATTGRVTDGWEPSAGGLLGAWGNAPGGQPPRSVGATSAASEGPLPHVQAFREQLAAPAQAASRKTGVPAELILAQAALETGWGRHQIITAEGGNSHNLFGIKAGSRWSGPTTEIVTHEYLAGERTRVTDHFRVYASFEEAFTDYARLISTSPRYAEVSAAQNPEQAARALQAGGYATDPAYANKLITIMDNLGPVMARAGDASLFQRY